MASTRATANGSTTSPKKASSSRHGASNPRFRHKIPPMFIIWLTISLPLVMWDTGYIFLRPHSMPGGKYHLPIWKPYALYGSVDYVYGWPAWDSHSGFTAAQASLNVVETLMYLYYMAVVWGSEAKALYGFESVGTLFYGNHEKVVVGEGMAKAVLVLFSALVMTISKTVLYWLNEYFSGFAGIGHNSAWNLFWLWILPNGLWLIFPTYMLVLLGNELVEGLDGGPDEKEE